MFKSCVLIAISIMLVSCIDGIPQRKKVEYKKEYCPVCKGIGRAEVSTGDRIALGLVTFGLGALVSVDKCDMCNGSGIVEVPIIEE